MNTPIFPSFVPNTESQMLLNSLFSKKGIVPGNKINLELECNGLCLGFGEFLYQEDTIDGGKVLYTLSSSAKSQGQNLVKDFLPVYTLHNPYLIKSIEKLPLIEE